MAAMNFDVIRRFSRFWPLLLIVGAVGFVATVQFDATAYPVIGGRYLGFYLVWAALLLIAVGVAIGLLAFVFGPKRAVFAMGLGSYVWYRALSLPDEAVTFLVRDSIMLSIVGAYLLTIGILGAIAHALSSGTGTQAKSFGTKSSNGVRAGQSRVSTARGAVIGAGAAAAAGLAAASANFDDDDGGSHFSPSVNIDGTPMLGGVDLNGNAFGVTSTSLFDDHFSSSPSFNIDGSPMMGSVDIHGNPYGVTSDSFSDGSFGGHSYGNDSFSSGGFGNDSF